MLKVGLAHYGQKIEKSLENLEFCQKYDLRQKNSKQDSKATCSQRLDQAMRISTENDQLIAF